ncbi:fimbrial chaperone, partial [Escherichia coli]|nr:fimbrial chaperone [Escherichia coli]
SGKRYPIDVKMIAPFSDEVMKVNGLNGKANSAKVHFYAINDFGGAIEGNARL